MAACKSLASVLRLNRGIDSDPSEVFGAQCAAFVRDPQALGQEQFELLSEPLAPMAQVRTLVRKLVLEEFRTGEVLEIGIVNPALTYRFVGQRKDVLEQEQPDDETSLDPGRPLSLYSGATSPSSHSQSILPASCTSSCFMLMI
jgi:hypothetical protein